MLSDWDYLPSKKRILMAKPKVLFLGSGTFDKPAKFLEQNPNWFVYATEYKVPTEMEGSESTEGSEWQETLTNMLWIDNHGGKTLLNVDVNDPLAFQRGQSPVVSWAPFDEIVFDFPHSGDYATDKQSASEARKANGLLMMSTFTLANNFLKPGGKLTIRESGFPYRPKIFHHGFENSIGLAVIAELRGFGHIDWQAESKTRVKRTHGDWVVVEKPFRHEFKRRAEMDFQELESAERLSKHLNTLEGEMFEKSQNL